MNKTLLQTTLVAALATSAGCGGGAFSDARQALLHSWCNDVILPLYVDFEEKAHRLQATCSGFADYPTAESLERTRASWTDVRAAFKATEVLAFGPYDAPPHRIGPKIDFWPARDDSIREALGAASPLESNQLSAAQRGLPAIEYLLYEPNVDVVAESTTARRRSEYLSVLCRDLETQAVALRGAWDPQDGDYVSQLSEAGRGSTDYPSMQLALGEIINRMTFIVENIRSDKLGRPLGMASGGTPQPDRVESRFSNRSIDDIRDNLRGVELLYFGGGEADSLGLDSYLKRGGRDFEETMRGHLAASRQALDAIPAPLSRAVVEAPATVMAASDQLAELQRFIQVDVANAAALSITFTGNDGD